MTSQAGNADVKWRRVIVGGVLVAGLMSGFGVPTALAQPAEPTDPAPRSCTGDDCKKRDDGEAQAAGAEQPTMTADQALMIIHNEYNLGDGGGQLSKLIDDVLNMRAQGFKPSNANKQAIQDALEYRPNQTPLVEALKATLAYQRKLQAQQQIMAQQQGPVAGPVPVLPGGSSVQAPAGPGTMTIPLG